jgi:hypothetical protein
MALSRHRVSERKAPGKSGEFLLELDGLLYCTLDDICPDKNYG